MAALAVIIDKQSHMDTSFGSRGSLCCGAKGLANRGSVTAPGGVRAAGQTVLRTVSAGFARWPAFGGRPAARPSRFAAPCGICIKSAALIRQQSSMSTPALISAIEIASNPACGYIKQKTRRLCLQSPSFFSSAARMSTGTIRAQRMPGDTVRAGAAIFTRSGCGPVRISFWQRYSCAGYP